MIDPANDTNVQPRPTLDEQSAADMLYEGGGVVPPPVEQQKKGAPSPPPGAARSDVERPGHVVRAWLEEFCEKWSRERLKTLVKEKGHLATSMDAVPTNMHRVANQTHLVLELIDDFREGNYREISWSSIAVLVGGLLYTVSPADVIPDVVPFFGQLDDLAVLALATRFANGDLRRYCEFKGYAEEEYFRPRNRA